MRRLLACMLVWVGVAVAAAAPSRPLYVPPELPAPPSAFELGGTTWEGQMLVQGMIATIFFAPDGTVNYSRAGKGGKAAEGKGSWTLTGNAVTFDINKFSHHKGVITGNIIEGESS